MRWRETVAAGGDRVGYQDASAFARLFREQVGMTLGARIGCDLGVAGRGPLAGVVGGDEGA
ncbi:hypothetical protein CJ010_12240 [Azoarcus sp. DD4]|nr:hypothetical protein CJ010_12240 [Azoarcus sp. DD4]